MPEPNARDAPIDPWERAARERIGRTLLGRWTLDAVLGVGGTSAVYAATHRNGNRVAIKILRPELAANDLARGRFLREGYVANKLAHDGAVAVLDDGCDDGLVFLVMDLLEGQTLRELAHARGGRLPLDEALDLLDGLLAIVAAAHAKGIVHRDLKPENVFVTRDRRVRVLDFGLARIAAGPEESPSVTSSRATFGTPAFMAPEQARGRARQVDARTDVWSLGATFFTVIAGRHVHDGATAGEMVILAGTQPAPPIECFVGGVPPAIARVIARALAFAPDARWSSAGDMRAALSDARRASPDAVVDANAAVDVTLPEPATASAASARDVRRIDSDVAPAAASVAPEKPTGHRWSRGLIGFAGAAAVASIFAGALRHARVSGSSGGIAATAAPLASAAPTLLPLPPSSAPATRAIAPDDAPAPAPRAETPDAARRPARSSPPRAPERAATPAPSAVATTTGSASPIVAPVVAARPGSPASDASPLPARQTSTDDILDRRK